jgi:hypothetical protein
MSQLINSRRVQEAQVGFPSFGVPKKNGTIRFVIDFHRTEEILTSIKGFFTPRALI